MTFETVRLIVFVGIVMSTTISRADDWPQWNGPARKGEYSESGVIQSIPLGGLERRWSVPVQGGYSGPAVASGKVIVTDYVKESGEVKNNPGGRDELTGRERVLCFDAATGEEIWEHEYARNYRISYAIGPRVTPTIDGEMVYCLGAEGDLVCLDTNSGSVVWRRQLRDEYQTETPIWGYAAAPLVVGELLITLAGGDGSTVVALDKNTGAEVWRALSASEIGYCPPTLIEASGKVQLLIWDADQLSSLNPLDGTSYWSTPFAARYAMSIAAPVLEGDRMYVSGIGEVGAMFQLSSSSPGVDILWNGKPKDAVYCANSTPYFLDGFIYGADCGIGSFICFDATTGKRQWETFQPTSQTERRASHGTAFITKLTSSEASKSRFYLMSETGDFIIADLTPEGYKEVGRQHVIDPTNECFGRQVNWSYPAFANRCLFVRNDKELVCYSLATDSKR